MQKKEPNYKNLVLKEFKFYLDKTGNDLTCS